MTTRLLGGLLLVFFWIQPVLAFEPAVADSPDPSMPQFQPEFRQPGQPGQGVVEQLPTPMLATPGPSTAILPTSALEAASQGQQPTENDQYFTLDEIKTEMKKLAWTKGDFTITPYGILWANMAWETSRSFNGDYVLYVLRPRPTPGALFDHPSNQEFHLDGRSTRLGFDLLGPHISFFGDAQTGGKVEIDFQRNFDTENRAGVLLRHAYIEAKNEDYRLLAGQTWDVISPLNPGVLFYTVGWDGGNIGYRRAQARAERYFSVSDTMLVTAQGSLNVDVVSDIPPTATASGFVGDHSGWPVIEGRLATALGPRGPGRHPIEMGVSGHIGEQIIDFGPSFAAPVTSLKGVPRRTWSLNGDIRVPITSRFGVQGEVWMGENLATFFGGIGQGIDVTGVTDAGGKLVTPPTGNGVFSRGGWVDVWYDWTNRVHSHAGYSIDDPIDADITSGRIYNAFLFANLTYDVTSKFLVGFEFTSWRTLWKGPLADAPDQHFDFVAKYGF
jgi:hypothetical protein